MFFIFNFVPQQILKFLFLFHFVKLINYIKIKAVGLV